MTSRQQQAGEAGSAAALDAAIAFVGASVRARIFRDFTVIGQEVSRWP